MEELRRSYSRLCRQSGAEPQEAVLQQLRQPPRGRLDLAAHSLTVHSCRALGTLLRGEALLTELVLSDCMLSEEGAALLLHGLCTNAAVRLLDLKVSRPAGGWRPPPCPLHPRQSRPGPARGLCPFPSQGNNLRATGAEVLGKLLRHNRSIQSLTLEWNSLGAWEDAFAAFCGGLAANGTLQQLDLRNNQISHTGAEQLALALAANSTLQELDLRWNNLGLLGGRALLGCFPGNRALRRLELAGNNIPGDVFRAVEQSVGHNQDRDTTLRESRARTHVLVQEVQQLREEKSKQFLDLMETVEKQRDELARSSRASVERVGQLQEALNERQSVINTLKAKLQMTEAALALSEQKVQELGELLAVSEREQLSQARQHEKERRLEQQEATEREAKFLRDLSATNEKNLLLRDQVDESERKVKALQEQLSLARQQLTTTTAELKLRAVQAEERLDAERKRTKQSLQDAESLRVKEVEHMRQQLEENERATQERVQRLEATRLALEEELGRVKAAALSERGQAEEELFKVRSQARLDEQRLAHLEEKLRLLAQARDEAQGTCVQQKQTVAEAQARASQLELQADGLRRRVDELQQELSHKEQEKVAEVARVRAELQAEQAAQAALREKALALERQLRATASDHREALRDRESENASLREKLRLREAEVARVRDEEAQRASFLQQAVLAYVQGSPLRTLNPPK
ncbi:leucine-rich repeat-containing protein 45 isoform X2 [Ochotona curzoniae]|uniref:leucine-rich repeat-containing protein 45 isoform X2 n=1 Tax=Ochotona curzoniae TaxID=130825 RepID=UPI001B34FCAA|nr:leucine-rich repeat-containing protein 45 isoform X2 [Ochotona curzoniae]